MITDKATYKYYVQQDLKAHQLEQISFYNYWWMDCLRFQLRLRKVEYLYKPRRDYRRGKQLQDFSPSFVTT